MRRLFLFIAFLIITGWVNDATAGSAHYVVFNNNLLIKNVYRNANKDSLNRPLKLEVSSGVPTVNFNPQQLVEQVQSGAMSVQNAAGLLQSAANINTASVTPLLQGIANGSINGININTQQLGAIAGTLQNITNGQFNLTTANNLLGALGQGQVPPQLAQAVSGLQQLQQLSQISSLPQLAQALGSSSVINSLTQSLNLGASAAQITQALGAVTNAISQVQALPQQVAAAVVNQLQQAAPGLVAALGGPQALTGALTGMISAGPSTPTSPTTPSAGACDNGTDLYRLDGPDCKSNRVAGSCNPPCNCNCQIPIEHNHKNIIRPHVTHEFMKHRDWMVDIFFYENILPAMSLMTDQLSLASVTQTEAIGRFFDAKDQLETQRVFNQLMAEAHKDYQPSEGMCEIGTNTMSLAASERKSDLAQVTFARRMMDRQLRSGDVLSAGGENTDIISRIKHFSSTHCDINDNSAFGLDLICEESSGPVARRNKDIDYTRTLESKLTLDADFVLTEAGNLTADEEDIFALTANLFAHTPLNFISNVTLATDEGLPRAEANKYMDLRSVAAKRSVAQNSIAAIVGDRAEGDPEVAKYLKRVVTELGVGTEDVHKVLGEKPSYFAQMEVLTKDIYQNPVFYTELYDKPANVTRKGVTLKALALMQDRDFYKSQLRSEAVLSVLLETMLQDEHNRVNGRLSDLGVDGESAE